MIPLLALAGGLILASLAHATPAGITPVVPRMVVAVLIPIRPPLPSVNAPPENPSCIGAVVRIT